MLKASHIKIAERTIKNIEDNIDFKVNKRAYLIGSVIPDLNCIYPLHTIGMTFKRFRKKLDRMDKAESVMLKSYTLGVITHYICDYFCYAHNIVFPNPKHAIYERYMKQHLKASSLTEAYRTEELEKHWKEIQAHIIEGMKYNNTEEAINSITTKGINHINYIIETVSYMHIDYIEKTTNTKDKRWCSSIPKIELDLEYSTFMCNKIALLILNPSLEMVLSV